PAAALRIDHVMGLHRLFWIPDGFEPRDGVYVRYPADAQWATISAASHRHRCRVVGEDLGTVPASVRSALGRHRALRTWVGVLSLTDEEPTPRPPRRSVASLSTHDTATFTAWWTDDRRARLRRAIRTAVGIPDDTPRHALRRLLEVLGASPAELVLVALDDL